MGDINIEHVLALASIVFGKGQNLADFRYSNVRATSTQLVVKFKVNGIMCENLFAGRIPVHI